MTLSSTAQSKKYLKFGKVDPAEVSMESYEADPDAGAVILFEQEHIFFDFVKDKFQIVFEVHRRIKILSSSEIDQADIEIPFYSFERMEEVVGIKGMTYNLEGGDIVEYKMDKGGVFNEDVNEFFSLKKFVLPNVKEGSVIEYVYRKTSERTTYVPSWWFQHEIPTRMSQLKIDIPNGFNFDRVYRGNPLDDLAMETATYRPDFIDVPGVRHIYTGKNIPAMKLEPYTSTINNYVGRLKLELTSINIPSYGIFQEFNSSWKGLTERLMGSSSYSSYLKDNNEVKTLLQQVNADPDDPSTFLPSVQSLVKDVARWNGDRGIYPNPKRKELLTEKEGNGASMNLLMTALLQEAGLNAYPILLSTRNHGAVQSFTAMSDQFNHVAVYVGLGDSYMILDATDPFCPTGTLPFADLNGKGFVLDNSGSRWASLESPAKMESWLRGSLVIDAAGKVSGALSFNDKGYEAVAWRKHLYRNDDDKDEYMETRVLEDVPDAEIIELSIENQESLGEALITKCKFSSSQFGDASGDFIYLQPLLFCAIDENPFETETRDYPVEFGARIDERVTFTLTIPEGYEIETLPEPTRVVLPGKVATFTYNTASIGSSVQILSTLEINKAFFGPEEYPDLRAFYAYVVNKQAEQIVLKKKS
ncbi:MAG: DUF3858 domain-containing protein [Bacteroidia bacterium]